MAARWLAFFYMLFAFTNIGLLFESRLVWIEFVRIWTLYSAAYPQLAHC